MNQAFPPHKHLCYYPSSGSQLLWAVMNLPCDLFVFSDKTTQNGFAQELERGFSQAQRPFRWQPSDNPGVLRFESKGKQGMLFREDNNQTLQRLAGAGLVVHHFVGICDGCREGGNQECVHERPFLSRLLPLCANGARYFTDHSSPLQTPPIYWCQPNAFAKYKDSMLWAHYPPPPPHREGLGPDWHEQVNSQLWLQLVAVLVRPSGRGITRLQATDGSFVVKHKGREDSLLHHLLPFRSLAGRERLAEYRVWSPDPYRGW